MEKYIKQIVSELKGINKQLEKSNYIKKKSYVLDLEVVDAQRSIEIDEEEVEDEDLEEIFKFEEYKKLKKKE